MALFFTQQLQGDLENLKFTHYEVCACRLTELIKDKGAISFVSHTSYSVTVAGGRYSCQINRYCPYQNSLFS